MEKAKPFVKWVGGKTQLLLAIKRCLPTDFSKRKDVTYIEPFVGGGAVLFWILQHYPNVTHAVINDINPDLISVYRTIKNSPRKLVGLLQKIQDEYLPLDEEKRKAYYLAKRDLFNAKTQGETENAALFIFLNRTCYNGLYRVNGKGLFNVPFGRYVNPRICDEQTIMADSELLQRVKIMNGDFAKTVKYASANTFFYFDPPYKPLSETSSFNSYAKESFDDLEQMRLADFCKQINEWGFDFILCNSDVKNGFFDELYKPFDIRRVLAARMVNANPKKRGKLKELMISNFNRRNLKPYAVAEPESVMVMEKQDKYRI